MNLLMSDIPLPFLQMKGEDNRYIDLSALRIANCVGCFGCWVKTPGRCVIRDDAVKVYPLIARSERLIYVTAVEFGSYGKVMKTMLERAIPIQQAFIRLYHGEAHHVQRAVREKCLQASALEYKNTERILCILLLSTIQQVILYPTYYYTKERF